MAPSKNHVFPGILCGMRLQESSQTLPALGPIGLTHQNKEDSLQAALRKSHENRYKASLAQLCQRLGVEYRSKEDTIAKLGMWGQIGVLLAYEQPEFSIKKQRGAPRKLMGQSIHAKRANFIAIVLNQYDDSHGKYCIPLIEWLRIIKKFEIENRNQIANNGMKPIFTAEPKNMLGPIRPELERLGISKEAFGK